MQQLSKIFGRRGSYGSFVFLLAVYCGLVSCNLGQGSLQLAYNSVDVFRTQLDREQYNSIYSGADEKFHEAISEADFVKLLQAIHNKLGSVSESNLRTTNTAWFAGQGVIVTLVYDTKFLRGKGTEQFIWHIKDKQAILYGYHINSNDLISK